jgi:hypothetical protein
MLVAATVVDVRFLHSSVADSCDAFVQQAVAGVCLLQMRDVQSHAAPGRGLWR